MNKRTYFFAIILSVLLLLAFNGASFAFNPIPTIEKVHFEKNFNPDIKTGDATSVQDVTNIIDTHYECDCTPTPTGEPVTPTISPAPTNPPSNNGGGGSGGSGGGATSSQPTQAVLSLSTTDSGNDLYFNLLQILAAGTLAFIGSKKLKLN